MQKFLFGRFLPGYIVVVSAVIAATVVTSYFVVRAAQYTRQMQMLTETSELVAAALHTGESEHRNRLITSMGNSVEGLEVSVFTEATPELPHGIQWPTEEAGTGTVEVAGRERRPDGTHLVYVLREIPVTGNRDGLLYIGRTFRATTQGSMRIVGTIAAGGVLLLIGIYLYLRRYASVVNRPVQIMRMAARRYAEGELDFEWDPSGPPEIESLALDLHRMAREVRSRLSEVSAQRNQLETILASMVEGVIVLDGTRRIVSMNDAAGELLNLSSTEGTGKTLLEHVRIADLDTIAESAAATDEPVEKTITLYRDQPVYLQVHATTLGTETDRHKAGVLLVMNNITRIKDLEKVRTDFVANVSHELKTPVTSIKGFVETLLDDPSPPEDQLRRFLGIVLKHTNRLNSILEDLLSLSRLELADRQIDRMPCSVNAIVEAAVEICRSKAAAKEITIEREFDGPSGIHGNPNLLEQALVNLVDNAIKYSDEHREVRISVSNRTDLLEISVADHGHGIRRQDLPRVFERFYRTDKARSRELGGTGLGLAIVKHIALLHDGQVSVESFLGSGSTFTLSIPQPGEATQAPG